VDGKTLVGDGSNFWNGATGKLEWTLAPAVTEASAFDVSRNGKSVMVAGRKSGGVLSGVWSVATRKLRHQRERSRFDRIESSDFSEGGPLWASDTQFSPDGQLLATASGLVSQASPLIVQNAATGKIYGNGNGGQNIPALARLAKPKSTSRPTESRWFISIASLREAKMGGSLDNMDVFCAPIPEAAKLWRRFAPCRRSRSTSRPMEAL
jgi:hypothetical protein